MEKKYMLDPQVASYGRTLWNNLVVGHMTSTLDCEEYKRITPREEMSGFCEFQYKDVARIKVIATNNISISAECEQRLSEAESAIIEFCKRKGCPLVEVL
jgi:hypothetical protein